MKIAVVMGTRPEIIRLYHTVKVLPDKTIYWTGQNFEPNLSDSIFTDKLLSDAYSDVIRLSTKNAESFYDQLGIMVKELYIALDKNRPDKILILGDTNSSLAAALVAKKMGVQLYHMEAGNRCYNLSSPEEINRKLIDSISDVHMCYTEYAKNNLLAEGVPQNRIHIIGNPISEFEIFHSNKTKNKDHILVTCHRQENEPYLPNIIEALNNISNYKKVVACIHPRFNKYFTGYFNITCIPSVPFSDFIDLQKRAYVIVTDSGTVCEEAAILNVPSVIIRETMERPELFDSGTCILPGVMNSSNIFNAIKAQLINNNIWEIPAQYKYSKVSEKVKNILFSKGNYV